MGTVQNESDESRDGITASELAKAYNVSPATIWRLKPSGQIPYFQPAGENGAVRFPPNAFEFRRAKRAGADSKNESAGIGISANDARPHDLPEHLSGPRPKWMNNQT